MSLLLDARKKSQQAQSSTGSSDSESGLSLSLDEIPSAQPPAAESQPVEQARSASKNLFKAKEPASSAPNKGINRNLLFALCGTVLLLGVGAGYVWYEISGGSPQPIRRTPPPSMPIAQPSPPPSVDVVAVAETTTIKTPTAKPKPKRVVKAAKKKPKPRRARKKQPIHVQQQPVESIDPLLGTAYQAYLNGNFEQAQQSYNKALKLDARNTDALLGIAVIAQRQGSDKVAAQYYARVLELDPRNAVANAGMSALATENSESRLKALLSEQKNSPALHSALGNQYAAQSRWAEAQQAYFNAYKLAPNSTELALNLAISLDRIGQKKQAVAYYQRALQLDSAGVSGIDHAKISQRIKTLMQ